MFEAEQSKQQTSTSETLDAFSSNSPQPEIIDTEKMGTSITESAPIVRRSTRERKTPERLNLYMRNEHNL